MTIDGRGTVTTYNAVAEKMFGYSASEVVGHNVRMLMPEPHASEHDGHLARYQRTGEQHILSRGREVEGRRKNGSTFPLGLRVTEVKMDQPVYIGTLQDLTERIEAERGLRRAEAELHQAQEMEVVGRLAGGVAHDFNNLLTVIVGHTAMLLRGLPASDPRRRGLAAIAQAGDRATSLTQQLLAFSRRDVVRPRVVNPNGAVTQVQAMLPRLLGERIRMVVDLDPDVTNVRVDSDQLEQVLMNLAVNARDAMPDGGILRVATTNATLDAAFVRAHLGAQPGAYVAVSVSDTGQGMDAATAAQVFEPFYTTKARGKGTGLGLATVYGIVKQSGGYIGLETAPGRGSTFTVYLPQVTTAEEPVAAAPPLTGPVRGTETVLVVEDEDELRALLRTGLSALGYTVLTASDGPEALALCDGDVPVDVLLTDVVMPDMNGRELRERLAHRYPGLTTLFMSGYANNILGPQGVLTVGVEVILTPRYAPNCNAHAERCVLSIKSACLNWMMFFGEASLRRAVGEYLQHYHQERPHQGLGNDRLISAPPSTEGESRCTERLGGLLTHYARAA